MTLHKLTGFSQTGSDLNTLNYFFQHQFQPQL